MSDKFNKISHSEKRRKFDSVMDNIDYISSKNIGEKVFLKAVIMRGINDSEKELSDFLTFATEKGFHPKFLQFEPQYESQKYFEVSRQELFNKLKKIGCDFDEDLPLEAKNKSYFPNVNFKYEKEGSKMGLHSLFGCGLEGACLACYDYLCIFIKPSKDGEGLYIKPCSVLDTRFDLTHSIKTGNSEQVLDILKLSREYLMLAPGIGTIGWNKEKKFDI